MVTGMDDLAADGQLAVVARRVARDTRRGGGDPRA